jgi:hypothetical protein
MENARVMIGLGIPKPHGQKCGPIDHNLGSDEVLSVVRVTWKYLDVHIMIVFLGQLEIEAFLKLIYLGIEQQI